MLPSSSIALLLLLVVPSLMAGPGSVPAPAGTLPEFDSTKCEDERNVYCYIPSSNKLNTYTSDQMWPTPVPAFQMTRRSYNLKQMLVEIWAAGTSAVLKDQASLTVFGCSKGPDGEVTATTERADAGVNLIEKASSPEGFYCRFMISASKPIFAAPASDEFDDPITFVTDHTYSTTRQSMYKSEKCNVGWINKDVSLDRKGYVVTDIPYENLFAKTIECPDGSTLIYESQSQPKEASKISCEKDTVSRRYYYQIVNTDDSETKKTGAFKAGCQRRECEQCSAPQFPAEVKKIGEVGDCPVYQCPHSLMLINDGPDPAQGDITCAKIKDQEDYDWTFDGEKVTKAACPTSLPCHIVSNLTCLKDPKCEMLVNRTATSLLCKDGKKLRVVHSGRETPVVTLACGPGGRFKLTPDKGTERDLPDGAEVDCADAVPIPPEASPQQSGSKLGVYVGCGMAAVAAIGSLIALAVCCAKRQKKKGGKSTLTQATTTTKAETTKTTRSAETKSASAGTPTPLPPPPPPPAQSVPIPPPTPIAVTTPYASSPWPLDMTEVTPNAPTPLVEPTQDAAPNSKSKSAPIIPLPKIDPPPSDGEQSKSGVESTTKKRGQQDSDVESKQSKKVSERVRATQQEESTKRTQNEPSRESTKRTQQTQMTRSVNEGGGRKPRAATRMPPKKAEYVAMNEVDEEFDSEEDKTKKKKQTGPLTQLTQPSSDLKNNPYLVLGDFNTNTPPKETTDYKNLVTQKSEEDKSKK